MEQNEVRTMDTTHEWSLQDVMIAYAVYRLRIFPKSRKYRKICEYAGIGEDTMKMALQNFEYLDGIGKMKNASLTAKQLHARCRQYGIRQVVQLVTNADVRIEMEQKLS